MANDFREKLKQKQQQQKKPTPIREVAKSYAPAEQPEHVVSIVEKDNARELLKVEETAVAEREASDVIHEPPSKVQKEKHAGGRPKKETTPKLESYTLRLEVDQHLALNYRYLMSKMSDQRLSDASAVLREILEKELAPELKIIRKEKKNK